MSRISEIRETLEAFLSDCVIYEVNVGICDRCLLNRSRLKMKIISVFDICYDCAEKYVKNSELGKESLYFDLYRP